MRYIRPRSVVIALCSLLATIQPAFALSVDPSEPSGTPRTSIQDRAGIDATPVLNPWLAAGLALAPPIVLGAIVGVAPAGSPLGNLAFVAPFTYGFGHLYAGQGLKAGVVALGGPIAVLGGAGLGALLSASAHTNGLDTISPITAGAATAATLYGLWAANDAYHEAERRNQLYAPGHVLTPEDRPVPLHGP